MPFAPGRNFAFVDAQNLNLGMRRLGWSLDYTRFRVYLRDKYSIDVGYMFLGYMPENQRLYQALQRTGFVLTFKEVVRRDGRKPKGNVDAEIVLQAAAIDYPRYDRAVLVTSEGDFSCLVRFLRERGKLCTVLSPERQHCSVLLRRAAQHDIDYLADLRLRLRRRP